MIFILLSGLKIIASPLSDSRNSLKIKLRILCRSNAATLYHKFIEATMSSFNIWDMDENKPCGDFCDLTLQFGKEKSQMNCHAVILSESPYLYKRIADEAMNQDVIEIDTNGDEELD